MAQDAFSEAEDEKFESEEALAVNKLTRSELAKPSRWLSGWRGVLIGTGLGMAISVGGMRLISRPTATPNVARPNQPQAASMSVTVAPVENTTIASTLNVTGSVAARDDLIPILPQVTGLQIRQILVREGNVVQAGQVLAILDNSVLRAQLDQAKAQVESDKAVVQQKRAALAQAQATFAEARQQRRRYEELVRQGAFSRQELETRITTATTAQEDVRLAQANISSAQADVRSSIAKVQQLQTQLEQTVVRAPVKGVVAEKIAQLGDVTNGTQKLFSIIRNGQLEVDAQVPATQLPQVRVGASARITSDADNRVRLQGRVREIAPLVDPQTRQATVKIDLPQTNLLRPGLFVRAAITTNTATGLTVPSQSVVSPATGGSIVFLLLGDGKVRAHSVKVGEIVNGNRVEIQGLKVGDAVVVDGAGYLKDGDRVQVVPQPAVSNPPP